MSEKKKNYMWGALYKLCDGNWVILPGILVYTKKEVNIALYKNEPCIPLKDIRPIKLFYFMDANYDRP